MLPLLVIEALAPLELMPIASSAWLVTEILPVLEIMPMRPLELMPTASSAWLVA
jgi:hypothetical protein